MMESIRVIQGFAELVYTKDASFTPQAWQALSKLDRDLANLEDEQNFKIANLILDWCDNYPNIRKVLLDNCRNYYTYSEKDSFFAFLIRKARKNLEKPTNKSLMRYVIQEAIQTPCR
jgi:hypothetical protein